MKEKKKFEVIHSPCLIDMGIWNLEFSKINIIGNEKPILETP